MMQLLFHAHFLKFKTPFGISKGTRFGTDSVVVSLQQEHFIGYGEAVMPPYVKENVASVISLLKQTKLPDFTKFTLEEIDELLGKLPASYTAAPAYLAAIDMALHDLLGKIKGKNILELYDLKKVKTPLSSYTIGLSSENEMEEKLEQSKDFSMLKVKLNGEQDLQKLKLIKSLTKLPVAVDFNQAWYEVDDKVLQFIENELLCEYIEEPFVENSLQGMAIAIPIIADEQFQNIHDLDKISTHFTGINIKLMKCGGLRQAYKIIQEARKRGLKILLGCMSDSSCGVGAMSHFSVLADWVDLDGPALIANDAFAGVVYDNGKVKTSFPEGIGVRKDSI